MVESPSKPEVIIVEKPEEPVRGELEETPNSVEIDNKRRDLGKLGEKLVNKSKIKKIKNRKNLIRKQSADNIQSDISGKCEKEPENPEDLDQKCAKPKDDEIDQGQRNCNFYLNSKLVSICQIIFELLTLFQTQHNIFMFTYMFHKKYAFIILISSAYIFLQLFFENFSLSHLPNSLKVEC